MTDQFEIRQNGNNRRLQNRYGRGVFVVMQQHVKGTGNIFTFDFDIKIVLLQAMACCCVTRLLVRMTVSIS